MVQRTNIGLISDVVHWFRRYRPMSCFYCGRKLNANKHRPSEIDSRTMDHILPISKQGAKKLKSNLVPCCYKCNQEKGSKTLEKFRRIKFGGKQVEFWGESEYLNHHPGHPIWMYESR